MKRVVKIFSIVYLVLNLTLLSLAQTFELNDVKAFENWCDAFVAEYDNGQNAPIAIVVVKDDQIFFQKGYGFVDESQTIPVCPEQTVFRAASVSKLVTTTAVMKLVEQGKINLVADINAYLKDFPIKQNFEKPITVADLLTHTSGLEERMFGNVVPKGFSPSLKEVFSRKVPRGARPAGEEIVYSNLGMALAGYLVEVVTGQKFEDFVEQEIFQPLEMNHSSFRQPYPPDLVDSVVSSGADDVALLHYPAGSMVNSAADMGNFLLLHLNGGKVGDTRILSEKTIREMQHRHFSQNPQMPGVAYGFFEHFANGRRILFHTGASGHQSLFVLLPEEKIGFYTVLSATQDGKFQQFRKQFLQAFLDRYFPATEKSPPAFTNNHTQIEGVYRPHLLSPLTIEKLGNLALDASVKDNGDGSISIELPPFGATKRHLVEIAPNLFHSDEGTYIAFNGEKMFMSGGLNDPLPFGKIRWYELGILHTGLFAVGAIFYGLICLLSIFFLLKKFLQKSRNSNGEKRIWKFAALTSWLYVLSPIAAFVYYFVGDAEQRPFKVEMALTIGNGLLLLAALTGVFVSFLILRNWRQMVWRERIWLAPFAAVCLAAIPLLFYWNLLGFNF
jgi:CubicO group peptidase (beta-lactamase class C family)